MMGLWVWSAFVVDDKLSFTFFNIIPLQYMQIDKELMTLQVFLNQWIQEKNSSRGSKKYLGFFPFTCDRMKSQMMQTEQKQITKQKETRNTKNPIHSVL